MARAALFPCPSRKQKQRKTRKPQTLWKRTRSPMGPARTPDLPRLDAPDSARSDMPTSSSVRDAPGRRALAARAPRPLPRAPRPLGALPGRGWLVEPDPDAPSPFGRAAAKRAAAAEGVAIPMREGGWFALSLGEERGGEVLEGDE